MFSEDRLAELERRLEFTSKMETEIRAELKAMANVGIVGHLQSDADAEVGKAYAEAMKGESK
jgi:hypothetical protein